jgi:hypothetical protein
VNTELQQRRPTYGSSNGLHTRAARRPRDIIDILTATVLVGGLLVTVLLILAVSLGLVWLIAAIVADLARRLGL